LLRDQNKRHEVADNKTRLCLELASKNRRGLYSNERSE
jgi:hypothetical protein